MDEFSAGSKRLTRARWEALDSASSTSLFAISEVRGLSSPAHSLVETNQLQEMMGVVSNPSHRHTRFFFTGDAVALHTVDRVATQCRCLPNAGVYPMLPAGLRDTRAFRFAISGNSNSSKIRF